MKPKTTTRLALLLLTLLLTLLMTGPAAFAAPVVSNLFASQRAGTKLVDIGYDVAAPGIGALTVSLEISSDAGGTWTVPVASATGHVGAGVAPGSGKAIVWDAGADWGLGNYSTQMRFRVVADDGVPVGFALIPGGSFTMGRTSGDTDTNAPPVTVTVSSFYMAETETSKAEWDAVRTWAVSNGYSDLAAGAGKASDHPVQTVSWWDVVKWCNARSEMEGLTPVYTVGGNVMRTGTTVPDVNWAANGYRLPTEAEWEKAARGGVSGTRFPWGTDTISHTEANYFGSSSYAYDLSPINDYHPAYIDGTTPYTSPVGSFGVNGHGLKNMSGNVWEWCWDWYGSAYYTAGVTDPRGPTLGTNRVYRGGGWYINAFSARASYRNGTTPSGSYSGFGFRSARSHLVDGMALIPGGSFTMGATSGDSDSDAPSVSVTVSTFYMAETETTKAQWDSVRTWAVNNGYSDLAAGAGKASDHPVQTVSWWDVVKWCNARSEMEGLTPVYTLGGNTMRTGTTGPEVNWIANGYRLPTEAEWEKAARGGVSGKRFPWGTDTISHSEANFNNNGGEGYQTGTAGFNSTYATGGSPYTSQVYSFAANGYGLRGMGGNVWEWCWDWYDSAYYTTATTDPHGPVSSNVRVVRGGSWNANGSRARAAFRHNLDMPHNTYYVGFRTARSVTP